MTDFLQVCLKRIMVTTVPFVRVGREEFIQHVGFRTPRSPKETPRKGNLRGVLKTFLDRLVYYGVARLDRTFKPNCDCLDHFFLRLVKEYCVSTGSAV